ncbi:MAG: hypothetical protein EPN23_10665 [Verrucomicrobia bacterium]|nr:MAG: hypothetical protein EPN23_10665 [Verrucomicrobiota bacterium]
MKRHALQVICWLLLASVIGCHRQPPITPAKSPLSVAISTNNIRIGDLIHLQLTSVHPTNLHLNPPDLSHGKEIIVRNRQEFGEKMPDGRVRETVNYTITSLVTGNHVIVTSPGIVWTRPDGTTTQAPFPFVAFKVQSMLTSTNADLRQLHDIHDLVRWPDRIPRWLLALAFSAIIIGLGAWLLRRYLARARALAEQTLPPPPHEVALAALRALLARGWIEQHQVEVFFIELSTIARRYLEARFALHAPEETTEEFLREAANSGALSPDHQRLVARFLEQSDLVKFARHQPGANDMRAAHAAAERLVRETIPALLTAKTSA